MPPLQPKELARLLDSYGTALTAQQRAAAEAFAQQEVDAYASGRKSKCFLLLSAKEAALKAGKGRVVFREPTQKHHIVFELDGSKTKGLAQPGSSSRARVAVATDARRASSGVEDDEDRHASPGTGGSGDDTLTRLQPSAAAEEEDDEDDEDDEDGRRSARQPAVPTGRRAGRAAAVGVALAAAAVAAAAAAVESDAARGSRSSRGGIGGAGSGGGGSSIIGVVGGGSNAGPRPETSKWFGREHPKSWDACMKHLRSKWPEAAQYEEQITMCRVQRRDQPRSGRGERGGGAHRNDYYFRVGSQIFRSIKEMRTHLEGTPALSFDDIPFDWGFDWSAPPQPADYFDLSRFDHAPACLDDDEAAWALVSMAEEEARLSAEGCGCSGGSYACDEHDEEADREQGERGDVGAAVAGAHEQPAAPPGACDTAEATEDEELQEVYVARAKERKDNRCQRRRRQRRGQQHGGHRVAGADRARPALGVAVAASHGGSIDAGSSKHQQRQPPKADVQGVHVHGSGWNDGSVDAADEPSSGQEEQQHAKEEEVCSEHGGDQCMEDEERQQQQQQQQATDQSRQQGQNYSQELKTHKAGDEEQDVPIATGWSAGGVGTKRQREDGGKTTPSAKSVRALSVSCDAPAVATRSAAAAQLQVEPWQSTCVQQQQQQPPAPLLVVQQPIVRGAQRLLQRFTPPPTLPQPPPRGGKQALQLQRECDGLAVSDDLADEEVQLPDAWEQPMVACA